MYCTCGRCVLQALVLGRSSCLSPRPRSLRTARSQFRPFPWTLLTSKRFLSENKTISVHSAISLYRNPFTSACKIGPLKDYLGPKVQVELVGKSSLPTGPIALLYKLYSLVSRRGVNGVCFHTFLIGKPI